MDHLFVQYGTGFLSGAGLCLGIVAIRLDIDKQLGVYLIALSFAAMLAACAVRISLARGR